MPIINCICKKDILNGGLYMFTEFDSTMFALFKPLFILSGIAIVVLLILVLIISFFIFIKRMIFTDRNKDDFKD